MQGESETERVPPDLHDNDGFGGREVRLAKDGRTNVDVRDGKADGINSKA